MFSRSTGNTKSEMQCITDHPFHNGWPVQAKSPTSLCHPLHCHPLHNVLRYQGLGRTYQISYDLSDWKVWAPAVVNEYTTRCLLGRVAMCRDYGTLGEDDLLAASLALLSIDHVLVLGQDQLNDIAMKAGMGWTKSLRNKHYRWCVKYSIGLGVSIL